MDLDGPSRVAVLATVAVDAGMAWMAGCVVVFGWSDGRPSSWARAMRARCANGLVLACGSTAAALVFDLWRRSAEAADVPLTAAGDATATMLFATHYGHAWMVAMAAVIAIAAAAAAARRAFVDRAFVDRAFVDRAFVDRAFVDPRDIGRSVIDHPVIDRPAGHSSFHPVLARGGWIVAFIVLACTRSVVSHAASSGDVSFAVAVDAVHRVTVSLWAGAVWVGGCAIRASTDADTDDARSWLRTLSRIATAAVAAIVLSGIANAWHATAGAVGALWGSTYGAVLVAKVALVLCAAALGGVNRWVFLPRLLADGAPGARPAHHAFTAVLRTEGAVLAGVLILAATLGNLEPPGPM